MFLGHLGASLQALERSCEMGKKSSMHSKSICMIRKRTLFFFPFESKCAVMDEKRQNHRHQVALNQAL